MPLNDLIRKLDRRLHLTVSLRWVARVLAAAAVVVAWRFLPAAVRQSISDLIRPTDPTEFWAMIAGVGTALLVLLAWRGLRSLGLTKSDMLTRAVRDAREGAITRCEQLATVILPMNGENLKGFAANKIPVFVQKAGDVKFDPDNQQDLVRARAWLGKLPVEPYNSSIRLLNELEGWAMYFTNQLADHRVAFGPCAPVYCLIVVQYYALLLHCRSNPGDGSFPNVVALFKSWNELLEEQARGLAQGALLKELARLQAKGLDHPLPPPLGL